MTPRPAIRTAAAPGILPCAVATLACSVFAASAGQPGAPRYLETVQLPTHSEGFHDWPSDEISAIEVLPDRYPELNNPAILLVLPDDRSEKAPARIGMIESPARGGAAMSGIRWMALRDERGRIFEENTVDPEAVRFLNYVSGTGGDSQTIVWTSEGYAKGGVQPAIFQWTMNQERAVKWPLPEAFLHDAPSNPSRGIFHNNGFESLAIDQWGESPVAYASVERPLIQDEGTSVCRVLATRLNDKSTHQYGYPLGPAPEGTDPDTLAVAELLCVGPRRFLVLENAELPDGETVASLFWISTDGASDLTDVTTLKESDTSVRLIEKKLLLDFSSLPGKAGLGNFEGMDAVDGKLYFVEDNEHGKAGSTRMLVFTLPAGLDK